jgi:hypothetical protein
MLYPTELWAAKLLRQKGVSNAKRAVKDSPFLETGRSTRIRTLDPLLPKQVRYRAAPHSEEYNYTASAIAGQFAIKLTRA